MNAVSGDGFVLISWLSPRKDGGSPIVEYSVMRGGPLSSTRLVKSLDNRTFSFNDTSVKNGLDYQYSVKAANSIHRSETSISVNAIPMGRPDPPKDVKAHICSGSIQLTWNPPTDDGGDPIRSFRVFRSIEGMPEEVIAELGMSVPNFVDSNRSIAGRMTYAITCRNGVGESKTSERVSADIPKTSGIVSSLKATLSDGDVILTWEPLTDAAGDLHYKIYRIRDGADPILIGTAKGPQASFVDESPVGGKWGYFIRAVNGEGVGDPSEMVIVTIPDRPEHKGGGFIVFSISIVLFMIACCIFILSVRAIMKK